MLCNDVLDLIGSYLDPINYERLMPAFPEVFTKTRYNKFQDEYEQYFSNRIRLQREKKYEKILSLNRSTYQRIYLLNICQYDAIQMIREALEYCNIFRTSKLHRPTLSRSSLEGYLIKMFRLSHPIEDKVVIGLGIGSKDDKYLCIGSIGYQYTIKLSSESLFVLYYDICYKFKDIQNIDNSSNAEGLLSNLFGFDKRDFNADELDEEYEAIDALIKYQNM